MPAELVNYHGEQGNHEKDKEERNISGIKSGEKNDKAEKGGKLPKGFKVDSKWYPKRSFAS